MRNPYKALREKLSRFHAWEAEQLKRTTPQVRFARFLALYDLKRFLARDVIEARHGEHLQALVQCGKRLKAAASPPSSRC